MFILAIFFCQRFTWNGELGASATILKISKIFGYHLPNSSKGEFCSKYNEIYSSPTIIFDTTESFTESCKQSLFTALSKRLSCVN